MRRRLQYDGQAAHGICRIAFLLAMIRLCAMVPLAKVKQSLGCKRQFPPVSAQLMQVLLKSGIAHYCQKTPAVTACNALYSWCVIAFFLVWHAQHMTMLLRHWIGSQSGTPNAF